MYNIVIQGNHEGEKAYRGQEGKVLSVAESTLLSR